MQAAAVILKGPKDLALEQLTLQPPNRGDVVVGITHSGISTGTEKLFWSGQMPPFPGMGYPLVPGYEAVGEVLEAGPESHLSVGDRVFVPGANCFEGAFGLFGGASSILVSDATRVVQVDRALDAEGALLALAATARHAVASPDCALPDLIVGHGVLGRLLARLTLAAGAPAPTVWEIDPNRMDSDGSYPVLTPDDDPRRDYSSIFDASGSASLIPDLIGRLTKGGTLTLAGFYSGDIQFPFAPAFMKEARLRIAAEWTPEDLIATRALLDCGALSLSGLVTHSANAEDARRAYETAFTDSTCLKMILDWEGHA